MNKRHLMAAGSAIGLSLATALCAFVSTATAQTKVASIQAAATPTNVADCEGCDATDDKGSQPTKTHYGEPVDVPRVDLGYDYDENVVKQAIGDELVRMDMTPLRDPEIRVSGIRHSDASRYEYTVRSSKWNYVIREGDRLMVAQVTYNATQAEGKSAQDTAYVVIKTYFTSHRDAPQAQKASTSRIDPKRLGGMYVTANPTANGKWEIIMQGSIRNNPNTILESPPTITINDFCASPTANGKSLWYRFTIDLDDAIDVEWQNETARVTLEEAKSGFKDPYTTLSMQPKAAANSIAEGVANAVNVKRMLLQGIEDRALEFAS